MPGAGKSTFAAVARPSGFKVINMGDTVREETRRQNLDITDANLGVVMISLREKYGEAAVAELCADKIKASKSRFFVIDGVRSVHEIEVFRRLGAVKVVSIQASPSTRYGFLTSRKRKDAPLNDQSFMARDARELKVGIREAIDLADHVIVNNNISVEEFREKAEDFLRRVKEEQV